MAELQLVTSTSFDAVDSGGGKPDIDVEAVNGSLAGASAEAILEWTRARFGDDVVLTSSFGAESALMLHLVSQIMPRIRVVFIDTGYLFPETYRFAEEMTQRFGLDVRVYGPQMTPARQEALYGKRWEGSKEDLDAYQYVNKVEPMDRALRELAPRTWIAGLRKHQTRFRQTLSPVELHRGVYKVHPILAWGEEDVAAYMREHELPYHPLYRRGYRSIGDEHSTFPTLEGEDPRAGRHLGEHKECGIHLPRIAKDLSQKSSSL